MAYRFILIKEAMNKFVHCFLVIHIIYIIINIKAIILQSR